MMNANAVATLGTPVNVGLIGPVNFNLLDSTGAVVSTQSGQDTTGVATQVSVTFNNVAPGTYTISAERIDAQTARPAAPAVVSLPFTVPNVTATIPLSVTVTLS